MKKLFKPALLIIRDRKLLVVRESGSDFWLTPGGGREGDESDEQCLAREIKEELCAQLDRKSLKYFGEFEDRAAHEPDKLVHITAYLGDVLSKIKPGCEVEEIAWVNKGTKLNLSAIIKNKIAPKLFEKGLIE